MRDKISMLSILAIMLVICSVFAVPGCVTGNVSEDKNTTAESDTVKTGGILKVAWSYMPDPLDPAIKWNGWSLREVGIYETLFYYDDQMNLQPELATRYEKVSDTEWRIYLREGVKFHDGTPLTADAVVFSLSRVISKNNTRSSEYSFIDSIEKYSDNAVTIRTKEPYVPLINSLTDPITSIVSPNAGNLSTMTDGTGPFKLSKYEKGVSFTVTRNDDYWRGRPSLDGAIFYYIADPMTRLMKLESGEADIALEIPQTEIANLRNSTDKLAYVNDTIRTYFLYINSNKAPFNDVNVRKALNYALNKEEICDKALEGVGGTPAKCIFPSIMSWSANDKATGYQYDPQKARSLLAQAGFSDTNGDGYLEYNGQPFTVSLKTYTFRPQLKPSAEVIVSQLKAIGINAKVEIEQSSAIESDMSSHNYDLALYAWNVAPTGDPDYMVSKMLLTNASEANRLGYSNPDMDALILEGRKTTDESRRKAIYDEIQQKALDDTPVICVFYQTSLTGLDKGVGNFKRYPNEVTILTKDVYLKA